MKNAALTFLFLLAFIACKQSPLKAENDKTQTVAANLTADASIVNVYYFHGTQRCKTCIAVGNIAKETVEKAFAGNDKVHFTEVNTSEEENKALVEKYGVTWNALIIAKNEQSKNITEQAFATAISSPEKLSADITSIVKSMAEGK